METHHNHSLFSEYYLNHLLPTLPEWRTADAGPVLLETMRIWKRFKLQAGGMSNVESAWIRPVLRALGHPIQAASIYDVRTIPVVTGIQPWNSQFDQPSQIEHEPALLGSNLAPAAQLHERMRATGAPWGILTNGRRWRLYHHTVSGKLDVFYEIDLPALIERGISEKNDQEQKRKRETGMEVADAFKYFYLFFRRQAFTGESCWLDTVLAASNAEKRRISRQLRDQAPEALRLLAQGFLDFPTNALIPTPETLEVVHNHSLIVLYWLLFILHAESQKRLPVRENPAYTETYSLHALTCQIASDIDHERPAVASMDSLWGYLRRLWRVLNLGNPDLDVPAHPGGLFDLEQHPFLKQHSIGDVHLRLAIDLLARTNDPLTGRRTYVDFRDLEIRHLGSIYERLLEYRLRVGEQGLELVPGAGERKATGTYYTPDHIVRWLVERTLAPVLDGIRNRHTEQQPDGHHRITTSRQALVDDILSVKVLDPAMGSGHFLVEAVDFIARYLVSLGLGPMADLEDEPELTYWRRRIAQSCVYGVDANPLAVELAKLSLWTLTAATGKPLTFLDHHLRCGDTLVGARMTELHLEDRGIRARDQRPAGQLSMLDHEAFRTSMQTATGFMRQIHTLGSETDDDVKEASHLFHDRLDRATRRYRILANIWTARYFGLQIGSALWSRLVPHVLQGDLETSPYADLIQHAQAIARRRRFFHWELEFPEVFFPGDDPERAGFDAIIGNPPYLFGEHVPTDVKPYLRRHYSLASRQFDIYWLFFERSFWLLKPGGRHGFIVPDALLARDEAEGLRARLLEEHRITDLAHPGQVFDDPGVSAVLLVWAKTPPDDHLMDVWEHHESGWEAVQRLPLQELARLPGRRLLIDLDPVSLARVNHLQATTRPLRTFVAVSRGEEIGRYHLRPIEHQRAGDVPILIGGDITPLGLLAPSHCIDRRQVNKAASIYQAGKIVMVKTGRDIVCTIDRTGYVTLQSVYNLIPHPTCRLSIEYLAAVLSSSLLSWYLQATVTGYKRIFPQLNQSNVEALPIRPIRFTTPAALRAALVEQGRQLCETCLAEGNLDRLTEFVDEQLCAVPERADAIHDLLAWLAEQAIALNARRQELQPALDPFAYLNRDAPCAPLGEAFAQTPEVCATPEARELQRVYHDIDRLRLVQAGGGQTLEVRLKRRDPHNWRLWQYEPGTRRIARQWVPACRLDLSDAKASYYQIALDVLDRFTNTRSFPGGHTRTTWDKLWMIRVPAFDPTVDLAPLLDRRREAADIDHQIAQTFELLNRVVRQLYGLAGPQIAQISNRTQETT